MKTKRTIGLNLICIGLAGLIAATSFGSQEGGSGLRGGGETIDVGSRPVLRDLVDNTVCTWIEGKQFRDRLSYFPRLLETLTVTHWYFSDVIRKETEKLTICMTEGPLRPIPTEDQDGLAIYNDKRRQVAIRLKDRVYIAGAIFKKMDDRNKAYLLLHETMHSFIPLDVPQRNAKLRSMVATIKNNEQQPMPARTFALQMKMNDVTVIDDVTELDGEKNAIQTIIDETQGAESRELAATRLQNVCGLLTSEHCRVVYWLNSNVSEKIKSVIEADNVGLLSVLIDKGLNPNFVLTLNIPCDMRCEYTRIAVYAADLDKFNTASLLLNRNEIEWKDLIRYPEVVRYLITHNLNHLLEKGIAANPSVNVMNIRLKVFPQLRDNKFFVSAISYSIIRRNNEALKMLLNQSLPTSGGDVNDRLTTCDSKITCPVYFRYASPLHVAADTQNEEAVDLLLARPEIDVNSIGDRDGEHLTPLVVAAERGNQDIFEKLVSDPRVSVNQKLELGSENVFTRVIYYSQMRSSFGSSIGVARLKRLLERKDLDINARLDKGRTPLMIAVRMGAVEAVKLIVEDPRVDLNAVDDNGDTARDHAVGVGNRELMKFLRKKGVKSKCGLFCG